MLTVVVIGEKQESSRLSQELNALLDASGGAKNLKIEKRENLTVPADIIIPAEKSGITEGFIEFAEKNSADYSSATSVILTHSDFQAFLPRSNILLLICGFEEKADVHLASSLDGHFQFSIQRRIKSLVGRTVEPSEFSVTANVPFSPYTLCIFAGLMVLSGNISEKITCNIF